MRTALAHLNAGTLNPPCQRLINGTGGLTERGRMICHCLLVRRDARLILVDVGLGTRDLADPAGRLGRPFVRLAAPALVAAEPLAAQLAARGIEPAEVTDVVLTHLDLDHAGGLADFPAARIHVAAAAFGSAVPTVHPRHRTRYRPVQWAHGPRWNPLALTDRWRDRAAVRLPGLDDVWLVAADGHAAGHVGVAVGREDGWLFHAGDAFFSGATLAGRRPPLLTGLAERVMAADARAWRSTRAWLRELAAEASVTVVNSHDPALFPVAG